MDHTQAVRQGCTENYLLGDMTEEERLEFEDHFFDCRECAEDVKTAVALAANARQVLAAEPAEEELPAPATVLGAGRWRRYPSLSALAAAAVLFLACAVLYQGVFLVPELRRELALTKAPQAVPWEFLSVSRSSIPVVKVSPRHHLLGLRLSKSSEATYAEYRCELRDGEDHTVQSAIISAPPLGEELGLVLPLSGLAAGSYVVILSGFDSPHGPVAAPELARYRFILEFNEE